MAVVEVFTSPFCGYCHNAKRLLTERGAAVTEIDVMEFPERRDEMVSRAGGRRTVPQVFIDGAHIGGYAELVSLDREGKLASLLGAAP